MLRFQKNYFVIAIILFVTEVLIAMYLNDRLVRPYVGDFLVVILIYCFVKSFVNVSVTRLAAGVLLFAYLIELLQYFQLVNRLGLGDSRLARTVLGSSSEWMDILAYTLGVLLVVVIERRRASHAREGTQEIRKSRNMTG